jgi:hypothetical protein
VEDMVAERIGSVANDDPFRIDPGLEQGHGHQRLDGRAGRVKAFQHLVDKRQMVVLRQHLPLVGADPVGEIVGIE